MVKCEGEKDNGRLENKVEKMAKGENRADKG